MEVAGSVAGIISLGIQVTQSLIDYYDAWKSQKSDVAKTARKLQNLLVIFKSLREQLTNRKFRDDEQDLLQKIECSIQECLENIQELDTKVEKFKHDSSNSLQAAFRNNTQRLAYPFKQGTLQKLDFFIEQIVTNLNLALTVLQQKDTGNLQNDLKDAKAVLDLVRVSQVSSRISDWLKAPDASVEFNEACNKKHPGTGLWLVQGSQFSTWLVEPNSFLWLTGFAGCGKSVLCSTAIQHTVRHHRSNPQIGVAFFFFTFKNDSKQDVSAMLRALVLQLSSQLNNEHAVLSNLHQRYKDGTPPHRDLEDCLQQLVRAFDHVYILLDALDESPREKHRQDVLDVLVAIRNWKESGLHLLVTSRDETDIRGALSDELCASNEEIVPMKNVSIDNDIASFISGYLKDRRELRKLKAYHDEIETALTNGAKGVFRWVECQLRVLSRCTSKFKLDQALESLPPGLDETYERILLSIDEMDIENAKRILTLLCYAKAPLTVPELIDATAVELGDNPRLNTDRRLFDEDAICSAVPGLIEIDANPKGPSTLRIAHFSVQEYLESDRILHQKAAMFSVRNSEANSEIASICLTYLLQPALSKSSIHDYPFAIYAAKNWPEHFRNGDRTAEHITLQALQLFQHPGGRFENWLEIWNCDDWEGKLHEFYIPQPLYYISLLGFDAVLSKFLKEILTTISSQSLNSEQFLDLVNTPDVGVHSTALQAASAGGHDRIVELLLGSGADVNAQSSSSSRRLLYGTALQAASARGHDRVVELLLGSGADLNAQSSSSSRRLYGTALQAASAGGHDRIVELLLGSGADVNAQSSDSVYGTALQAASAGGHDRIVELLLGSGADVNAQSSDSVYGTALQAASAGGHDRIIELLLGSGADVNAQSSDSRRYGTALQAASAEGHDRIVELLLGSGADVNAQSSDSRRYGTALQAASAEGHDRIVELLLGSGADVNAQSSDSRRYGTALQAASAEGHDRIVELLLGSGADVNAQSSDSDSDSGYGTALQAASAEGHDRIVELLLGSGADVNAQSSDSDSDSGYGTALQAASAEGHDRIVELLLGSGADVNAQSSDSDLYGTALQAASAGGHDRVVKLLISHGAVK